MERLLSKSVCMQTQALVDTPMVNRSPGHLDLFQMMFLDR